MQHAANQNPVIYKMITRISDQVGFIQEYNSGLTLKNLWMWIATSGDQRIPVWSSTDAKIKKAFNTTQHHSCLKKKKKLLGNQE